MALKFGPQWLRDLSSDSGANNSQPHSPTVGTKFKLADYRYGREEMLSLWNINSPPPDQVRKHLSIFSKEIQKPITMMPLTEDEQRLVSQGFNSTGVLRAAGRGSAPTLRVTRGGGTADRGRGRGRGRGEGYVPRSENGDIGYHRSTQDGWEQVGRKLERSYSRGYEDGSVGNMKREFSRSASDNNWRDKRQEEEEEDESNNGGAGWRAPQNRDPNPRWGAQSNRRDWRDPRDLSGFEGDRRLPPHRRGFEQDMRGPRRTSESHDNDGEVPEWVEDDVGDDPGTFDSSGAFVSTKDRKKGPSAPYPHHTNQEGPSQANLNIGGEKGHRKYVPPNARNGAGHGATDDHIAGQGDNGDLKAIPGRKGPYNGSSPPVEGSLSSSNKGDGDSGFSCPHDEEDRVPAPPGSSHIPPPSSQSALAPHSDPHKLSDPPLHSSTLVSSSSPTAENAVFPSASIDIVPQQPPAHQQIQHEEEQAVTTKSRPPVDPAFAHVEKSLQNLVAQMTLDAEKDGQQRDVSREALPLTHENASKWFYKDPQGEIQGPFTNEEMAQWFGAGYFTMSLVVKRGCDDSFKQLGELIKRYGRVPFLPGTPLPPLISTSTAQLEDNVVNPAPPVNPVKPVISSLPQTVSSMANPSVVPTMSIPSLVNPVQDPLLQQMMMLQQEYLKQTFLMRQMQVQTLQQLLQEQENFASLPPDQQQHMSMQVMMQANPLFMQQLQRIQQQQLILQQQLQQQQLTAAHSSLTLGSEDSIPKSFPQVQPSTNVGTPHTALASTSSAQAGPSTGGQDESLSVWGNMPQQPPPTTSVWSHVPPQSQPQPTSLWDVDASNETLSPAYKAQLEKVKRAKEEERLREEERVRQEELERKQEEIHRQQEELKRQREQVRREKEELERQKQLDIQKREEARRKEEEARQQEEERIQQEIERQQREQQEAEKRRQEEERRRQEEERKKEKELKKQEEKKRKEEEKRRLQEEQKRLEEARRKKQEQEELEQEQLLQAQREEEERIQREAMERERAEAQRKQLELQRQHESMRRLQQAQREQLANMQLPAHSNWADQQGSQGGPTQSRSLTEIQEEEARREHERQLRQQQEMQRLQEQAILMGHQNQQKSWATHASQGMVNRGPSLLDIQQQEQENMKKSQKEKPKAPTYQSKLSLASASTWASGPPSSTWPSNSHNSSLNQQQPQTVWEPVSTSALGGGIWDQPLAPVQRRPTKESGEFPALKNPAQQNKKAAAKTNNKGAKAAGSKQKKEEETVQKLFQSRQQDDFTQWVTEKVSRFSAQIDVPTFVSFIVEVDSPDDVRDYMVSYLGDNKESRDFAKQFVDKRSRSRNKARLERQQEEDSIWGPAPAVNPHIQTRPTTNSSSGGGDASEGGSGSSGGKGAKNRKKKQKMQKLDGSILGFTVHSDPNRKNAAGELESVQ